MLPSTSISELNSLLVSALLFPSFSALFSLSRFFIFFHSKHLLSQIPTHSSSPFPPISSIFTFPLNSLKLSTTHQLIAFFFLFFSLSYKTLKPHSPDSARSILNRALDVGSSSSEPVSAATDGSDHAAAAEEAASVLVFEAAVRCSS